MVVLVDRSTLGASEVLATVLRQKVKAELVGERTFGHAGRLGSAELSTGGSLLFTEAFYTGPDKEPIKEALKPDLLVDERSRTYLEKDVPMSELILKRAIRRLRGEDDGDGAEGRLTGEPPGSPQHGSSTYPPVPRRSKGMSGFWLFVLGVLMGAGVLYFGFGDSSRSIPADDREASAGDVAEEPSEEAPRRERPAVASPGQPEATPVTAAGTASAEGRGTEIASVSTAPGRIALVIDDLGRDVDGARHPGGARACRSPTPCCPSRSRRKRWLRSCGGGARRCSCTCPWSRATARIRVPGRCAWG